jgi:uncharacterized protein with HEPN domain
MKHDITTVLKKHIAELDSMLLQYGVSDKASLLEVSDSNMVFQKAVLMTVGYIGELSKKLGEDVVKNNPDVNWRRLGTSRNIIFHDYDIVDMGIIATVIFKDVLILKNII